MIRAILAAALLLPIPALAQTICGADEIVVTLSDGQRDCRASKRSPFRQIVDRALRNARGQPVDLVERALQDMADEMDRRYPLDRGK